MTSSRESSARQSEDTPPSTRPNFSKLVELRAKWRIYHQQQDRKNAEEVFRSAGVGLVTDLDLKFFPHLFRQKLNEFGRDWERTLAAQALRENYTFYRAQLQISVDQVNELQASLESLFHQCGAPLFFESNGVNAIQDGVWDCLFYFVIPPEVLPESIGIEKAPGVLAPPNILRIA